MTPIVIAVAVKTPLYLPLYIAERFNFFQLGSEDEFTILAPSDDDLRHQPDADRWACERILDGVATFAVCDPAKAVDVGGAKVVATIISRAVFWAVNQYPVIDDISNFNGVSTIYTYPVGMSAYNVAVAVSNSCVPHPEVAASGAVNDELGHLLAHDAASGGKAVAITANLAYAKRFVASHKKAYALSAQWCLHPVLSNLMLTGLLIGSSTLYNATAYSQMRALIAALNRAAAMMRINVDLAAEVLRDRIADVPPVAASPHDGDKVNAEEAKAIVKELNSLRIYPVSPVPEPSSWHNAVVVQTTKSLTSSKIAKTDYDKWVVPGGAQSTEEDVLRLVTTFGLGPLDVAFVNSLVQARVIRVSDFQVVGGIDYCRADEGLRRRLRGQAESIMSGLLHPRNSSPTVFCIWGHSGSGKTEFVKTVIRGAASAAVGRIVDLGKLTETQFRQELDVMENADSAFIFVADEFDNKNCVAWGCEVLYSRLLPITRKPASFIIIGSLEESLERWVELIKRRPHGPDLMRRIPPSNRIAVPVADPMDVIVMLAATIATCNAELGRNISEIEKLAVYYLRATKEFSSAGDFAFAIKAAMDRLPVTSSRLVFDDFFEEHERNKKHEFFARHYGVASRLIGTFLEIEH